MTVSMDEGECFGFCSTLCFPARSSLAGHVTCLGLDTFNQKRGTYLSSSLHAANLNNSLNYPVILGLLRKNTFANLSIYKDFAYDLFYTDCRRLSREMSVFIPLSIVPFFIFPFGLCFYVQMTVPSSLSLQCPQLSVWNVN